MCIFCYYLHLWIRSSHFMICHDMSWRNMINDMDITKNHHMSWNATKYHHISWSVTMLHWKILISFDDTYICNTTTKCNLGIYAIDLVWSIIWKWITRLIDINQIAVALFKGSHPQKAYTHSGFRLMHICNWPIIAIRHSMGTLKVYALSA